MNDHQESHLTKLFSDYMGAMYESVGISEARSRFYTYADIVGPACHDLVEELEEEMHDTFMTEYQEPDHVPEMDFHSGFRDEQWSDLEVCYQ